MVALTVGKSAAEGTLTEYLISGSKDGTMGVFQAADGALTYKHKCGTGISAIATFDPTPGTSALLLVGYEVGGRLRWMPLVVCLSLVTIALLHGTVFGCLLLLAAVPAAFTVG